MRFIHAADIHLDSPLTGLSAYQDAPAELLRTTTRDAFENLVSLALEEQVDFMVIAGDLYDGNWRDFNTCIFFSGQSRHEPSVVRPPVRAAQERLGHWLPRVLAERRNPKRAIALVCRPNQSKRGSHRPAIRCSVSSGTPCTFPQCPWASMTRTKRLMAWYGAISRSWVNVLLTTVR